MKFLLLLIVCALAAADAKSISNRLANGSISTQIVPHHVHLLIRNSAVPGVVSLGSGVLISQSHVLTVAFNIFQFDNWSGGIGSTALSQLIYFQSISGLVHENYNPSNFNNNIGIITFMQAISGFGAVPATLPPFGTSAPNVLETGSIAGFGFLTSELAVQTEHLQVGSQSVLTPAICLAEFPQIEETLQTQFCAINIVEQVSPCGGEQGGGFEVVRSPSNWVVGLISHTQGECEIPSAITYYVQISHFRLWILINVGI